VDETRLLRVEASPGEAHRRARPVRRARQEPHKFYLPLARSDCQIVLTFRDETIVVIESGPAFDASVWKLLSEEVAQSIGDRPPKVGREYSFSSFRVAGSWRGTRSGVQILPPPDHAPRAPVETAEHPFILEFPLQATDYWPHTNYRRMREHRNLTRLLNVLLVGSTCVQLPRSAHFWASVPSAEGSEIKWVQQIYFAKLGDLVIAELSPPAGEELDQMETAQYYTEVGRDGRGLCVPSDLDESICLYQRLGETYRAKFDRAAFWMDMASRQWSMSVSSSFASLISAAEALTERGAIHRVHCEKCLDTRQHEVPGATERFRAFFERYAPGASLGVRRAEMYGLRSGVLHGSKLLQLDRSLQFGWDPPGSNQLELYGELSGLMRMAARNWLKEPGTDT
jgi:hypothetical protein